MHTESFMNGFWTCVASQEKERLREYFLSDAIIKWHCTNECFTINEYITANCEYPGRWSGEVERLVQKDDIIITVTRVWTQDISFHVTSFFKMENGKIKELDEYFGDDGIAPKWRLDKQIGRPIKAE